MGNMWEEMIKAEQGELDYIKENKIGINYQLSHGRRKGREGQYWLYEFRVEEEKGLQWLEDAEGQVRIGEREEGAHVVSVDHGKFLITLALKRDLGEEVERTSFKVDLSALYERIKRKLQRVRDNRDGTYNLETVNLLFDPQDVPAIETLEVADELKRDLNDSQGLALDTAISKKVCFIWGPPGTGKTRTLGRLVVALVQNGKRVLITAHSNRAVDNALIFTVRQMVDSGFTMRECMKLVTRYRFALLEGAQKFAYETQISGEEIPLEMETAPSPPSLDNVTISIIHQMLALFWLLKERMPSSPLTDQLVERVGEGLQGLLERVSPRVEIVEREEEALVEPVRLEDKKVVAATLTTIAVDETLGKQRFDYLIVDEASMAPLPLLAIAASLADHVVIIGDPFQLPPIALSEDWLRDKGREEDAELVRKWLKRDIFVHVSEVEELERLLEWAEENAFAVFLDTQYRMPRRLCNLVSDTFYSGKIRSGIKEEGPESVKFINTDSLAPICEPTSDHSRRNEKHAERVVELVRELSEEGFPFEEIGVIAPYRAQAALIREKLRERFGLEEASSIEVGTIHAFQGRERDVIIFDVTDAQGLRAGKLLSEQMGEKSDIFRLLCVALSRARKKLIIIGPLSYLMQEFRDCMLLDIIYNILFEEAQQKAGRAAALPPESWELKERVGRRVKHKEFGEGIIFEVGTVDGTPFAYVVFDDAKVGAQLVPMHKLE